MLAYAMVQEHATFINYRNLKHRAQAKGGDPALAARIDAGSLRRKSSIQHGQKP